MTTNWEEKALDALERLARAVRQVKHAASANSMTHYRAAIGKAAEAREDYFAAAGQVPGMATNLKSLYNRANDGNVRAIQRARETTE